MRRVSSRQRLVSWDAFDAAAASDDETDFMSCYEASLSRQSSFAQEDAYDSSSMPLRRKRERPSEPLPTRELKKSVSFSDLLATPVPPAVVTAHPWEVETPWQLQLDSLVDDVQLNIVSYLTVSEARALTATSTHYRRLLLSQGAVALWMEWFHRRWPNLIDGKIVDLLELPTAAGCFASGAPNLSVLLGMASRHQPTGVDRFLLRPRPSRTRRSIMPIFRTYDDADGRLLVQYTGTVGTGDRCIRANQPLAGPRRVGLWSSFANKASLLDFLCRGARAVTGSFPVWRPFVAPYVTKTSSDQLQVHMTPRLVSYFEVSILPCPEPIVQQPPLPLVFGGNRAGDCVAVGLATSAFHIHSRMPGWDSFSYGYHGDDGGIFHGSGDMTRRFGPSFGPGDTVGCGVDYVTGGIFFTHNSKFLGYGWTGIDLEFLQQDLYPTVGVDTNCPVHLNFGERPFCFDLTSIVERQKVVVKECCSANRRREGVMMA